MRIEGTLAKWNDERGFGFISPTKGGTAEVFVHVSAFPRDGQRPSIGELLTFEIEIDKDGKKRAKNLLFPDRALRLTPRQRERDSRRRPPSFLGRIISFAVVVALVFYGYGKYAHRLVAPETVTAVAPQEALAAPSIEQATPAPAIFQCDGRIHCSQMTSCAEATFFLKNCPDVRMDGDHDGIACEQQWCN